MASLNDNDFDIFGISCQFALNRENLTESYLKLQNQTHPDRFANATAQDKRLAVQWATRINEAYKRLSNPIERAIYWCTLQGQDPKGQQSNMPPALLMQQMEWHEALEELHTAQELENLLNEVNQEKKALLAQIETEIDQQHDAIAATQTAQGLLFVSKFLLELNKKLEKLEDAS